MSELDRLHGRGAESVPIVLSSNPQPEEAQFESEEVSRYLLAKSYFDCREYDRCAAVFIPDNVHSGPPTTASATMLRSPPSRKGKGKASTTASTPVPGEIHARSKLPRLSQKALFLALYAKFMAGEKRKDEESEMILGPVDGGVTSNKELVGLSQRLESWCAERSGNDETASGSQGWLEYL